MSLPHTLLTLKSSFWLFIDNYRNSTRYKTTKSPISPSKTKPLSLQHQIARRYYTLEMEVSSSRSSKPREYCSSSWKLHVPQKKQNIHSSLRLYNSPCQKIRKRSHPCCLVPKMWLLRRINRACVQRLPLDQRLPDQNSIRRQNDTNAAAHWFQKIIQYTPKEDVEFF